MSTNQLPHVTDRNSVYVASSTGMLHVRGCQSLRVLRSRITPLTEQAAAKVTYRCRHCVPMPFGEWVEQDARPTVAERHEADHAAAAARRAERDAAWAASHTPEADAAIRAFCETDDQATYDAMMAALPHDGYNPASRARELGLAMP